jgi:hypothetical protein
VPTEKTVELTPTPIEKHRPSIAGPLALVKLTVGLGPLAAMAGDCEQADRT